MADVKIKVSSDTTQFQSGMRGVQNTLNSVKGSVNTLTGAIAAVGIAKLAGAFGSFSSGLIKDSSSAAASFETLSIQLEVLTGSAAKSSKLIADMRRYGAQTPLQQGDIQQSVKTLLGFGIESEKVMGILKMLGDTSQGSGQALQSMSRVFGQVSSAGKVSLEDINQLTDAGFNPLNIMANQAGIKVSELKDRVSDGTVNVQMLEDAFRAATSTGGRFNNMLARIAGTTEGNISNLIDTVEDLKISFGTGLNVGLGNVLDKATPVISEMKEAATLLGKTLGGIITRISEELPTTLKAIEEAIKNKGLYKSIKDGIVSVLESDEVTKVMHKLGEVLAKSIPNSVKNNAIVKTGEALVAGSSETSTQLTLAGLLLRGVPVVGAGLTAAGLTMKSGQAAEKDPKNTFGNVLLGVAALASLAKAAFDASKVLLNFKNIMDKLRALPNEPVIRTTKAVLPRALPMMKAGLPGAAVAATAAAGALFGYGAGQYITGKTTDRQNAILLDQLNEERKLQERLGLLKPAPDAKSALNARLDAELAAEKKIADAKNAYNQRQLDILNKAKFKETDFYKAFSSFSVKGIADTLYRKKDTSFMDAYKNFSLKETSKELGSAFEKSKRASLIADSLEPYTPVLTSLARIGGAKSTTQDPLVTIQTRANELLQIIANNTKNNNSNRAVFN